MKENYFHSRTLLILQETFWYLAILYFSVTVMAEMLGFSYSRTVARWGVVLLMVMSVITVVTIAEQFRKARLYRLWLLSYMLVIILASTVIFGNIK